MKYISKALKITGYALIALLIVLVGYIVYMRVSGKIPMFFGNTVMRIVSPSMESEIPTGSFIIVRKVSPEDVRVGDVISFYSLDEAIYMKPNTHRVVEIIKEEDGEYSYVTKGDNNPVKDGVPALSENLIGVYVGKIAFLGVIGDFFSNKAIFFVFILLPALAIFTMEINNVTKKAKEVREQELIEKEIERLQKLGSGNENAENSAAGDKQEL